MKCPECNKKYKKPRYGVRHIIKEHGEEYFINYFANTSKKMEYGLTAWTGVGMPKSFYDYHEKRAIELAKQVIKVERKRRS